MSINKFTSVCVCLPLFLVLGGLASCAALGGPSFPSEECKGDVYENVKLREAILEVGKKGGQVSCMLMPDSPGHVEQAKNEAQKAVADTGLVVKVGLGSGDEAKIARYKGLLEQSKASKTFDVPASDQVLFEGVQYIVIYETSSRDYMTRLILGPSHVYDNKLVLSIYWVQDGSLVAQVTAKATAVSSPSMDSLVPMITAELQAKGLPGTKPPKTNG